MSDLSIATNLAQKEAPLSEQQQEEIRARIATVREIFPEFASDMKALVAAGLVRGWRDLEYIGPPRENPREVAFDATQMVINRPAAPARAQPAR
ncbi:MAG: hypothetical protein OEL20_05020 [Sulfuritalea sp.]|nr:hypothetical protein [Sulfuritalea sp.]